MKKHPVSAAIIAALYLSLSLHSPAVAMDDPGFVINRMVLCENIADREPVAISGTFSATTERVYCFLEAGKIERDTIVTFVWYYEDSEIARVSLPLAEGRRWRTFASKRLAGLKGDWQVELREASGIVLNTLTFTVQ